MRRIPILMIVMAIGAACGDAPVAESTTCSAEPKLFCEPFVDLASKLSDEDKSFLANATGEDLIMLHHGFGTGVRNEYGLWKENALTQFFRAQGVEHPDDMSGHFICGLSKWLRKEPTDMVQIIAGEPRCEYTIEVDIPEEVPK